MMRAIHDWRARRREAVRAALLEKLLAWLEEKATDAEVSAFLENQGGIARLLVVKFSSLCAARSRPASRPSPLALACRSISVDISLGAATWAPQRRREPGLVSRA